MTQGVHIGLSGDAPELLAAKLAEVTNRQNDTVPMSGSAQGTNEVGKFMANQK
jgi:hypothetical protein